MLEATENVFISLSLLKRPLFLSQDILEQLNNIRTRLKAKFHEAETELEESEKRERSALELKSAAIEEYNNAARRVEEIDIAKLKEVIKQEKQKLKQELKRIQDECASHAEINSVLLEEKRKLKEALEMGQALKDDMLDTAERVREHFAELDAMYNHLMATMMSVNAAQEESVKRLFEN
jgi:chromosome segregation ATPase